MFHRMGTDPRRRRVLFRQFTKAENEKLATTWGPFGACRATAAGSCSATGSTRSRTTSGSWTSSGSCKTGKSRRRSVTVGDRRSGVRHRHRRHAVSADDERRAERAGSSPRARRSPEQAHWRDLVPERPDAVIEGVSFGKGVVAVTYLKNASNVVEVFDLDGQPIGRRATSPASAPPAVVGRRSIAPRRS